jgi:2-polyprenyl-6-hydroxyphenyl methylase/3-demethylubiquinone-9 3-methyltransferase
VRDGRRPANDPGLYDDLAGEWWKPRGAFAPLHWLAAARAAMVPRATRAGSVLVDIACGGGLLAPHVREKGHRHVGIDIGIEATSIARSHGVETVRGNVCALPFATACVDVVVAGEIFEHLPDLPAAIGEIGRVLSPGGVLVCDTLADTRRCALLLVTLGERLPVVPRGIHDPTLFVAPERLRRLCADHGIELAVRGVRPSIPHVAAWLLHRREDVAMRPTRSTGIVYQGFGVKRC